MSKFPTSRILEDGGREAGERVFQARAEAFDLAAVMRCRARVGDYIRQMAIFMRAVKLLRHVQE